MSVVFNHYISYMKSINEKYQTNKILGKKDYQRMRAIIGISILVLSINILFADTLNISVILEDFINALISVVNNLVIEFTKYIGEQVLFMFPQDMTEFYEYLGGGSHDVTVGKKLAISMSEPLRTVAMIFTNVLFIFHLIICATGNFTEQKNTPLNLIIRYIIATLLQLFSISIGETLISYTSELIQVSTGYFIRLAFIDAPVTALTNMQDVFNSYMTRATTELVGYISILNPITAIVWLCLGIAILINLIKLTLEIYERYVTVCLLNLALPLGFCFMTSRTTSNITVSYFRMYLSQLFLMLYSYLSVFLAICLLPNCLFSTNIVAQIFLLAFLRVAQKVDSIMGNLGLNVAHTSGSLFDDVAMAGRSIANLANGLQRGAHTAQMAQGRILDGAKLNALKSGNLGAYVNTAQKQGKTAQEGIAEYLGRKGTVGSGLDAGFQNHILSLHAGGQAISSADNGGRELLNTRLNGYKPHNMVGDYENVKFGTNGKITADYKTADGHTKHAVFSETPFVNGKGVAIDTPNGAGFGDKLYMQVADENGNGSKALDFSTIREEATKNMAEAPFTLQDGNVDILQGENGEYQLPFGTTEADIQGNACADAVKTEYGVDMPEDFQFTAQRAEQNAYGDLLYYDADDNLLGTQLTEDSFTDRSRFSGTNAKSGTTLYPEDSELTDNDFMLSIPETMRAEFDGKEVNLSNNSKDLNATGIYTAYSTNSNTGIQTETRIVSMGDNPTINKNDTATFNKFLYEGESVVGRPQIHVNESNGSSYMTFQVKKREQRDNNRENDRNKKDRKENNKKNNRN